jgi:Sec-independent protein translocase protein TatA
VLNLDPAKLVVILVLALVVMGPDKMQSSARHFGTMFRSISEFREKAERQVRDALPDLDLPHIPTSPRAAVTSYVSDLLSSPHPTSSESPSQVDAVASVGDRQSIAERAVLTRRVAAPSASAPTKDDVSMN